MDEMMMNMASQPNADYDTIASPSPAISIRNDPSKPEIRVIHVFAPTIIETDTSNFRELVQRLTGKPADRGYVRKSSSYSRKTITKNKSKVARVLVPDKPKPRKAGYFYDFRGLDPWERPETKDETVSDYLKDFVDLDDGFVSEQLRGLQSPRVDPTDRIQYFDVETA